MKMAKQVITIAMERSWPTDRTVAFMPEAMPRWHFSTELMIAFVLGEEKNPYPSPRIIRLAMMIQRGVKAVRNMKQARPAVVSIMPAVETIRGSTRSESFPATGEMVIWTTGWATRI